MITISRTNHAFPMAGVRHRLTLSVVFSTVLFFVATTSVFAQIKVVGYVTNDQYHRIDYPKLTHLNIAFENPDVNGNISFSDVNDAYIREARSHGVKVLISLVGGGASHEPEMQRLYFNLIKDSIRSEFVKKIKDYVRVHNLDGVDVDLEGPAINSDYGKFIAELSTAMKANNKLLTSALSHLNGASKVPDSIMHLFDFINVMAYDQTGPWRPEKPGQHSSFEFALESLDYWIQRGLPKDKAVLGVPFYGYGFGKDFNQGIGFAQILKRFPHSHNDDVVGNTIYYNGVSTIRRKSRYVKDQGYGGIMIWQLAHDTPGEFSLLGTVHKAIQNKASK